MWCPTSLVMNEKETEYPVPEPYLPLNFINSTGMRYEAEEVRQCLLKGTKTFRLLVCIHTKGKKKKKSLMVQIFWLLADL